jgi:hypothetical protein
MTRISVILFLLLLAITANFLQADCFVTDTNTLAYGQELINDHSVQPTVAKVPEPLLRWESFLLDAQVETPTELIGDEIVTDLPPPETIYITSALSRRGPPCF